MLTSGQSATLALIVGNLVPLLGALFLGWDLLVVFLIFWIENAWIGLFAVLQIILAKEFAGERMTLVQRLREGFFFAGFYGLFLLFHGLMVLGVIGTVDTDRGTRRALNVGELADHVPLEALGIVALALLVSRGIEFYRDKDASVSALGRMILLHVVLFVGGVLAAQYRTPVLALVVLVVLKTLGELVFSRARLKAR